MKLITSIFVLFLSINFATSQVGGIGVYKFLDVAQTARMTAMGDNVISIYDDDVNMALENPGLLNESMFNHISVSHKFLFAGISSSYAAYGFKVSKWNLPLHAGIQYVNYGELDGRDLYGDINGKVSGSDMALVIGTSKMIYDKLSLGINVKLINSNLATYNSFGAVMDLAAVYFIPEKNITAGLVIKNLGGQISTYSDYKESTQLNVLFGITKKLKHLPFRFSITAQHLNRWNLLYDDPNGENNVLILGESQDKSKFSEFTDNLFRHINFSGEFLLGKGEGPFRLRMGYNYMKSKEMSVYPFRSFAGMSFGFGLRIKKIRIDYGYAIYHLIGGKSHLTISTNLSEFGKKL